MNYQDIAEQLISILIEHGRHFRPDVYAQCISALSRYAQYLAMLERLGYANCLEREDEEKVTRFESEVSNNG